VRHGHQRIYHFLKAEHGLDDIRQRRLKLAMIDRLNDPFEFLGVASRDRNVRRQYQSLKDGLAKYMGLLCFSDNWRNPMQWSHYAEHHRGICLGFDVSPMADLRKVVYVNERIKPNRGAMKEVGELTREHTIKILTTKFRHWRYEQEHRLFVGLKEKDEKGFYWYDFSDDVRLREVIIGACSDVARQQVADALGDFAPQVRVRNARLAFQTFDVVEQKNLKLCK
jgi:hypothetical protein